VDRAGDQVRSNADVWRAGEHLVEYANRRLLPVEVLLLVRHREALSGRVLEVGCGAGRILGYLVALGGEVHGIDISPAMVGHCRSAYPAADVQVGDLGDLRGGDRTFTAVLAMDNVLDVFDDPERRRVLGELRELLADGGVLIFSSHNLGHLDRHGTGEAAPGASVRRASRAGSLLSAITSHPLDELPGRMARVPRRIRNRRRLAGLQRRERDHAIVNDAAHDYAFLHYYIRLEDQARQLAELGYELVECLDSEGRVLGPGADSPAPWLHYVARRAV
jgi:SAM-dependent methyltransferase